MATTVANKKQIGTLGPNDVYIGRPSFWGNKYSHRASNIKGTVIVATVEEAIAAHKADLHKWLNASAANRDKLLAELDGKRLVCWCKPGPCHGDTLAEAIEVVKAWRERTGKR